MRHQSVENFRLFSLSLVRHPEVRHQSVEKSTPFFTKLKSHYNTQKSKLYAPRERVQWFYELFRTACDISRKSGCDICNVSNIYKFKFQKPYTLNSSFFMPVTIAQKYACDTPVNIPWKVSVVPMECPWPLPKTCDQGQFEMSREEGKPWECNIKEQKKIITKKGPRI